MTVTMTMPASLLILLAIIFCVKNYPKAKHGFKLFVKDLRSLKGRTQ
jgi:hypothetical protein